MRAARVVFGDYIAGMARGSVVRETAQMPLYTLRDAGTTGQIARVGMRCIAVDCLLAAASLLCAVLRMGRGG